MLANLRSSALTVAIWIVSSQAASLARQGQTLAEPKVTESALGEHLLAWRSISHLSRQATACIARPHLFVPSARIPHPTELLRRSCCRGVEGLAGGPSRGPAARAPRGPSPGLRMPWRRMRPRLRGSGFCRGCVVEASAVGASGSPVVGA